MSGDTSPLAAGAHLQGYDGPPAVRPAQAERQILSRSSSGSGAALLGLPLGFTHKMCDPGPSGLTSLHVSSVKWAQ